MIKRLMIGALLSIVLCISVTATETENIGIRVLPAPGKVKVDGKIDDWDLSGGIFACSDAEVLREKVGTWVHLMYDKDNLYILSRWIDETPRNNPGSTAGDLGFQGDCLQVRIITDRLKSKERISQISAWFGNKNKKHVIGIDFKRYAKPANAQGGYKDAQKHGAKQAFGSVVKGKSYVQEMALPWAILTKDKQSLKAGDSFIITVEPNFTAGVNGRITIKDIFRPGVPIDRVFTFMGDGCWGKAKLLSKGNVKPQAVRLSDAREFSVKMVKGQPVVDWKGLVKSNKLQGHKEINYTLPVDGFVSMHIKNSRGEVIRQLLTNHKRAKGKQTTRWDGLTTKFLFQDKRFDNLGDPLPPGKYSWSGIYHTGIGIEWRGWASNGGIVPWDSADAKGNWGGDHGVPSSVVVDKSKVYLGWTGAEAGKGLVAVDLDGKTQWLHKRGGIGGAPYTALDNGIVYCVNGKTIFRLDVEKGNYSEWKGSDASDIDVTKLGLPAGITGLSAGNGKVYISYTKQGLIAVIDGRTGKLIKKLKLRSPTYTLPMKDTLIYVSSGNSVIAVNPKTGSSKPFIANISGPTGIGVDKAGKIYVGSNRDQQVHVFSSTGKKLKSIGKRGGRPRLGLFDASGMLYPGGIGVDAQGKLWVAEKGDFPKRFSVWDTKIGKFVKQFFGPTHYGASGSAISARDPNLMVGDGVEWQLDPKTGRAKCVGTIRTAIASFARFCYSPEGTEYIMLYAQAGRQKQVMVYERLGPANYKLRATIKGNKFWSDKNGDEKVQGNETYSAKIKLGLAGYFGWSVSMNSDFTLYPNTPSGTRGGGYQIKVDKYTKCNAPVWNVNGMKKMPHLASALSSVDNTIVVSLNGDKFMQGYETATGKLLWSYPNAFYGVHGSHKAPPPITGMLRGVFGFVGSAKAKGVAGNIWAVNTNVGEWHIINGEGYYLSHLFQGNPLNVVFPDEAKPGIRVDDIPPGLGGEDFGGTMVQGQDGKIYIQAGKTGIWNLELVGLETVKRLGSGSITITKSDFIKAKDWLKQYQQNKTGVKKLDAKKLSVKFTGNIASDFKMKAVSFEKFPASQVKIAIAWDSKFLYLGYDVNDATPWQNRAKTADNMYANGDTVDFQLSTDSKASEHSNAILGDLRLSIGSFKGKATAVIYRSKATDKKNKKLFHSGVFKNFVMESVKVVKGARINVTTRNKGYIVEAAIPLSELGFSPKKDVTLRADFGVTHGDKGGNDTALRSYWSNQATGIVNDEVEE
ncbi:MAG: PQQ-binding-like beta-propeller repeat protein, partial [Lentisphaeria bacterium]|nr:PQQ-binding-like beta-propeller repeat protein [Lentisphaeria bacterium]